MTAAKLLKLYYIPMISIINEFVVNISLTGHIYSTELFSFLAE
ncbi:hypothetical protein [Anaerocolumna sp. MB42-C2]|nr:hypothetical protein [Anaerocolumna sp. MB42-C2]WMJ87171.1 hypothetical protein RBU59_24535 [Anaerocolumna sp. MB42-C2]